MSTFDFRILLETIGGQKTSYYSSSFVDTSVGLVLSASQVYNRITGSVSASYQNQNTFSGSNFNKNFTFKDNTLLSASLSGSQSTGSIQFTALDTNYDRLLRYKFIGEKVTNVLGLPSNQWVYVDQIRLPADDEANFLEGNIRGRNAFFNDTITFANTSNVNSDIPFLIDATGSDRYIKFVDDRGIPEVALRMGYDVDSDVYEISGSDNFTFDIGNVHNLRITDNILHEGDNDTGISFLPDLVSINAGGIEFMRAQEADIGNTLTFNIANKDVNFIVESTGSSKMLFVDGGTNRVGINKGSPTTTLEVEGDISASGDIIGNRYIVNSTVSNITQSFSSGSTIFGDTPADDTHQFTGSVFITGSSVGLIVNGNISASGDILNTQIVEMTNSSSVINTFNTGSFQTCKYLLQVTSASKNQSSEMLVMQNSSNAFNAEYAQINSGLNLVDFTTEVNNSNVELIGSSSFVNCSVKFVRTLI